MSETAALLIRLSFKKIKNFYKKCIRKSEQDDQYCVKMVVAADKAVKHNMWNIPNNLGT